MVTPKYDPSVDFSDENLSQTLLALMAGSDRAVLDVGCATGYLAQMLRSRGCRVDGIEYDPVMAQRAAPHVDRIEVGDVQAMDLPALFGPASYDVVVFGDVLEHLTEPLQVLKNSLGLLKPGGAIVISIPNVAHGAVRLQLLQGRFDYTSTGLLDETHVRFFTRETVLAMLDAADLAVVEMRRTTAGLFETEVQVFEGDFEPEVVQQVLADPEATTYQFVVRAVPRAEADEQAVQAVVAAEAARLAELPEVGARAESGIELPSTPAARVGLWGSWDHDDLSQALLGRVVSAELVRRLPGVLLRFFAPYGDAGGRRTGLGEPVEELGPHGSARARALSAGLDAVLVVGRVDTDPAVVAARHAQVPRPDEPGLHLVDGPAGIATLWGPVSLDGSPVSAGRALTSTRPLPDPGLLAARVLPLATAARRADFLRSAGWLALSDRVVAVHLAGGTDAAQVIAALQDMVDADPGLSIVALEMDTSSGDGGPANEITSALQTRALLLPVDGGVDSALAAIAISDLVVSTSATTRAIAASYGVPAADLQQLDQLPALLKAGRQSARPDTADLDAWFDEVAAAVRAAAGPADQRSVLSATERYAAMERAHAVMRARAWTDVQLASEATPRIGLSADAARADADRLRTELEAMRNTLTFRALERPRRAYSALRRRWR